MNPGNLEELWDIQNSSGSLLAFFQRRRRRRRIKK